ncbi:MAG: sigma 54-interacting transcriptional regulator [Planctomycetota bacterium]
MVTSAGSKRAERDEAGLAPPGCRQVLVVDRDPELRVSIAKALFAAGFSHTAAPSPEEARACLRRGGYGLVVLEIESDESLRLLEELRREFPGIPAVAVSKIASPEIVRDVLRCGAEDFLFGKLDARTVRDRFAEILSPPPAEEVSEAEGAVSGARDAEAASEPGSPGSETPIVSRNPKMRRLLEIAETVAPTDATVLIEGESGTGKEVLARRIHALSPRSRRPFVEVNCGALPGNLLESQLFGHERGSFTGAVQRQVGLFEIADRGTIFLDEIGELGLDMQVKLLRVLQFKEFRRIGGRDVVRVDVRVIAATNKDLAAEVERKTFRPDLFYRLNVISLRVPPLRERSDEIPDFVELFAERIARERGVEKKTFSPEAIARLQMCRWSGNIRELENTVERAILLCKGERVEAADLEEHLGDSAKLSEESPFVPTLSLDEVKRIHVARVLRENRGNKMRTARILKINVKTLYNLIRRLGIEEPAP